MAEKLASLRKKGGGGKISHYRTTVTGATTVTFTVTGKVKYAYIVGTYGGTKYSRGGTDSDIVTMEDGAYSATPFFTQNGNQLTLKLASNVTITWTIDYWSE